MLSRFPTGFKCSEILGFSRKKLGSNSPEIFSTDSATRKYPGFFLGEFLLWNKFSYDLYSSLIIHVIIRRNGQIRENGI